MSGRVLIHIRRECAAPEPRFYAGGPWWECPDCGAHAAAEFISGVMAEPMRHRDVSEWVPVEQIIPTAHKEQLS